MERFKVVIAGAGIIGAGIGVNSAVAGFPTVMLGFTPSRVPQTQQRVKDMLDTLVENNVIDEKQLAEINLDYEKLRPWFSIRADSIRRINLNRAGIERLRSHPYIDFYQAKAIVEYRRKHGVLKSLKVFALYEEFTPDDLERISHYACFE